jgi:tRNA-modifying protein YgfZ
MSNDHLPGRSAGPHAGELRLYDWGLIRASGADAASFLHSQLTQDIQSLMPGQARLAGYCSAKGRLLASFVVWRPAAEEVLLACSADLLPATLKRLSMFVLRAKCKLADASAERPLWGGVGVPEGLSLPAAEWGLISTPDATTVRLPDADGQQRWLRIGSASGAESVDPERWLALEARSGIPRIVAATAEQFVPQMINLELIGGVNFQKGCYPGQEVVARSQYRGTTKRRALLFETSETMAPGQEVFHSDDPEQPAGLVVLAGRIGSITSALVEVKLSALGHGSLHAARPGGALLQPAALPYAVPLEAEANA